MSCIAEDLSLLVDEETSAFVLFSDPVDNHLSMFKSVVVYSNCMQKKYGGLLTQPSVNDESLKYDIVF